MRISRWYYLVNFIFALFCNFIFRYFLSINKQLCQLLVHLKTWLCMSVFHEHDCEYHQMYQFAFLSTPTVLAKKLREDIYIIFNGTAANEFVELLTPMPRGRGGRGRMTSSDDVIAVALSVTSEKVAAEENPVRATCIACERGSFTSLLILISTIIVTYL